jgi:hypothetical protein
MMATIQRFGGRVSKWKCELSYLVRPARPQNFSIVLPFPAQQSKLLAQWQNRLLLNYMIP